MKGAYYNEFDPFAAAWLGELMKDGLIAPGEIDTRSIEDVHPTDLQGFAQCHFFAGIGVWSAALRRSGWEDNRPIWTGSCPCQPFSAAGKGGGFADERHLWPAFFHLIGECRPPVVAGEQVASKDGLAWLDLVQADLEGAGYAVGAVDTCAAGFGAPHIRQRLYWVADANDKGPQGRSEPGRERAVERTAGPRGLAGRMADANEQGSGGRGIQRPIEGAGESTRPARERPAGLCEADGLRGGDDAAGARHERQEQGPEGEARDEARLRLPGAGCGEDRTDRPRPTNGLWRDVDWLGCRDGKWRPVEPGTFPLAHAGAFRNRVAELRGAGNAINRAQAEGFIAAYMDTAE